MSTSPRIGIDARLAYYRQGGITQYVYHLIDELPRLDAESTYLILHSRKDRRDLAHAPNQRRVACWTPAHHRLERLALAAEVLPLRLDLLHSPDFIPPYGGRQRSVITIHDLTFLHYPEFLTAGSRRYYNAQIGAAAREVHRDCGAALQRLFALRPVLSDEEGAEVDVPAGFDAGRYRLVGNVAGEPPFQGRMVHHGWEATACELPTWSGTAAAARVVAPVEVELK